MRENTDPLWDVVGERVRLQGHEDVTLFTCPKCLVEVELPRDAEVGSRFRCGLCGTFCEVARSGLVSDDGAPQTVARLAE